MPSDPRAVESLLGFWAEAGVDAIVLDAPVDRLAERPRAAPQRVAPAAQPQVAGGPDVSGAIAAARKLAAEAGDLDALAAAIAAFDGCGLKREGARQAVFSRGAAAAPVMLIGEAPGAEEDVQGAPFVGRAGKLLDRMLVLAGGAAAKALLQRPEGILALRGRWFDWTSSDGALALPALPTLHPAFLLRQPAAKKRAWADLMLLAERLGRAERP
jgi:uracil-DNA glycosylase